MSEIILSVIVSTYNRADCVRENVGRMLSCERENIEILVGDNASTDDTLERLSEINDPRMKLFSYDDNWDIRNVHRIRLHAKGKYFIFVNDRDYIPKRKLEWLCDMLERIDYPYIVFGKPGKGEYEMKGAEECIYASIRWRHPGRWLWNTEYYNTYMNPREFCEITEDEDRVNYVMLHGATAAVHLTSAYHFDMELICQPKNREYIKRSRKELFGSTYIALDWNYHLIEQYFGLIRSAKLPNTALLCRLRCEDAIRTVSIEFYHSLKKKNFAKRNSCENLRKEDWLKNGILMCIWSLKRPEIKGQRIKLCWRTIQMLAKEAYGQWKA